MKKARSWIRRNQDDLFFTAGCLAILIGTYQFDPRMTWFVGGVELLITGFLIAWSKRK